jgi:hypothetical protein
MEEWELDVVCKVCGNLFGVGLTVSVPSLKEMKRLLLPLNGTVWMLKDHHVRVVTCQPCEQDVDPSKAKRALPEYHQSTIIDRPCKLQCTYQGLDFRHIQSKNGSWEMAVQACFVKVKGNAPAVIKAQGVVLSTGLSMDAKSEDLDILEGDLIRLGTPTHLTTYIVDSIDVDGNVCCKDPTKDHADLVYLTMEEAKRRFNEYIR